MRATNLALFISLTALTAFRAGASTASAIETANGTAFSWRNFIGANQSADVGWSFLVGAQNLQLTALGIFDQNQDGLEDSHVVALWTSGGALITEATVPSGTTGSLVGSYRYHSVTPVTLLAGQTYVLGAHFAPVVDLCGSACGDATLSFALETFDPGITYLASKIKPAVNGDAPPAFPSTEEGVGGGIFGPNFLITTADTTPAPEPANLGLAACGIGALLARGLSARLRRRPAAQ
jgi:hypothetical protein